MPVARRPGRKPRSDAALHKRERIVEAATELFYTRGFHNTTLDDVADRLGMTKPFIYSSFGSKAALLAEICFRGVRLALDAIELARAQDKGPAATLEFFLPRYVAAILRAQKNIAINIREEKNLDADDAERLADLRHAFMAKIEDLLQAGQDAGDFAPGDSRISAFAIVGAASWATFWYHPGGALPAEVIASRMSQVILGLVRPTAEAELHIENSK